MADQIEVKVCCGRKTQNPREEDGAEKWQKEDGERGSEVWRTELLPTTVMDVDNHGADRTKRRLYESGFSDRGGSALEAVKGSILCVWR